MKNNILVGPKFFKALWAGLTNQHDIFNFFYWNTLDKPNTRAVHHMVYYESFYRKAHLFTVTFLWHSTILVLFYIIFMSQ